MRLLKFGNWVIIYIDVLIVLLFNHYRLVGLAIIGSYTFTYSWWLSRYVCIALWFFKAFLEVSICLFSLKKGRNTPSLIFESWLHCADIRKGKLNIFSLNKVQRFPLRRYYWDNSERTIDSLISKTISICRRFGRSIAPAPPLISCSCRFGQIYWRNPYP